MRNANFVHTVKRYGHQAYETARHTATHLDNFIQNSAKVYGHIVQPILKSQGYDTSSVDSDLMNAYNKYSHLKTQAYKFDHLLKG